MKKIVKLFVIFIFSFFVLSIGKYAQANSIDKISMDIYIEENGDAKVTETWKCYTNQGTEVYHPYFNLGNSQIQNLEVREGSKKYDTLDRWNTSASFETKAYKCGINKVSNGVELCWGMSSTGNHVYTVEYEITNFVSELTDSQMVYWTLIPKEFSNSIGTAYIKIHADQYFPDDIDVWGYGNYGGTAYVYDGYIEMQSDGRLATNEYMTILVKFPQGTFNTTNYLNNDFSYYYNMSQEGATTYTDDDSSAENLFVIFITIILPFALTITIVVLAVTFFFKKEKMEYENGGKKIAKDIPYFRDIPCNKDILRAYYIATKYYLLKNKTDLLGAIILKWIKDSLIRLEIREQGKVFKKDGVVLILNETNSEQITNSKEKKLFDMIYQASKDGVLENKEFESWCKIHYERILRWFEEIISEEEKKLIEEGNIKQERRKVFIFSSNLKILSSEMRKEAEELAGLKRFLLEYTLIPNRQAVEVTLFEEYMVFAQMLGIAKEVSKEFKELYPEVIEQSNFSSYDNIIFINACASRGISSAQIAKSRAESYSSGGGGFSSGGGGGGSFGGGGGGRRFPLKNRN